jgi:BatD DUF11 like domain
VSRVVVFFALVSALLATLLFPRAALAEVEVRAWADATTIAVGDPVDVHLRVTSSTEMPTSPELTGSSTRNFQTGPPALAPTRTVTILNGVRSDRLVLTVTWTVTATRPGAQVLSPSVLVDGTRRRAPGISVQVVARGQAPQRPPSSAGNPFSGSPLDPWKGLLGALEGDDDPMNLRPRIQTDPKLALDAARGRAAFLHAAVDKPVAVVGEQVTLSIFLYVDSDDREPDFNDVHEASVSDFVKRSLLDDENNPKSAGHAKVGGRVWTVKLVRRFALFPLKAGTLAIGPMRLAVIGPLGGSSGKRESEQLDVIVSEPPLAGRPPGYVVGDVGQFQIAASVAPSQVERGGAVSVTVDLSGTGNLPANITPPLLRGVEWLPPETREKVGNNGSDRYGGKRTFTYVVRMKEEGDVDLGEIKVPFYDADARVYGVAAASLGHVRVVPGGSEEADAGGVTDPLPNLPAPRAVRAPPQAVSDKLADRGIFWTSLFAAPVVVVAFAGARAARRRLATTQKTRIRSPDVELRQRIADADAASAAASAHPLDAPSVRALDAASVRALEQAALVKARVNVRALTSDAVAARLEEHGVTAETAREIAELLGTCERARFSPAEDDDPAAAADAGERWTRAKRCIDAL